MDWKTVQIKALCLLLICLEHFYFLNLAMFIFFIQHFGWVLYILIFPFAGGPGGGRSTQVCSLESAGQGRPGWARSLLRDPSAPGLGEGRVHCIKKDPCTPFLLVWFPLEPAGWDFHICVFPSFTFKSHSKSSALFNYIRRCERQGPSRKQNLSQMVCLEVGKFFSVKGQIGNIFGFAGHVQSLSQLAVDNHQIMGPVVFW